MNLFVKTLSVIFLSLMLNVQAVQAQRFEWVEEVATSIPNEFELRTTKILKSNNSNYFISGSFIGTQTVFGNNYASPNSSSVFIAKLDSNKNFIWIARGIISSQSTVNTLVDFIIDSAENIYFLASVSGTSNFGNLTFGNQSTINALVFGAINQNGVFQYVLSAGSIITQVRQLGNILKFDSDGNILIWGSNLSQTTGFVQKRDLNGSLIFIETFNATNGRTVIDDVLTLNDGSLLVLLEYKNLSTVSVFNGIPINNLSAKFFVRINQISGNIISIRKIFETSNQNSQAGRIVKRHNDNVVIGCNLTGSAFTSSDTITFDNTANILIAELDSNSNIVWYNKLSSPNNGIELLNDLIIDNTGSIYLAGNSAASASFANVIINPSNQGGAFIIKLLSNGNLSWFKRIRHDNGIIPFSRNGFVSIQKTGQNSILFSAGILGSTNFDTIDFPGLQGFSYFIGELNCAPIDISAALNFTSNNPCQNSPVNLTAQNIPFTNYNWTATGGGVVTAVGNQATVSWPNPGTYTVSVNPFNACGSANGKTDTIVVRGTPPQPDSLIGDTVVCFTGTRAYSIPLVAGAANYSWSLSGGGSLIPINNTAIVNWNAPGTYTLRVTPNNDCGIGDTLNTTIVVTTPPSQPGLISGNTDVCTGNQNYTLPGLPDTDYLWSVSSGGTLNSNGNTASINWSVAGTHTITVIPSNGCATGPSRNLTVTVKQAPSQPSTIIGNNNSCLGFQSYSILETTGTNYTWSLSSGGTLSAFAGSATINWNQGGVHVLSVTPQNSCGSGPTRSLQVVVNDVPPPPGAIQGLDTVCLGAQSYAVSGQSGTNYNWSLSGGGSLTPTGSSALINWTNPGNYTLTVSPVNICGLGNQVSSRCLSAM